MTAQPIGTYNLDNNKNFESPRINDHVHLHELLYLFNFRTEYI